MDLITNHLVIIFLKFKGHVIGFGNLYKYQIKDDLDIDPSPIDSLALRGQHFGANYLIICKESRGGFELSEEFYLQICWRLHVKGASHFVYALCWLYTFGEPHTITL